MQASPSQLASKVKPKFSILCLGLAWFGFWIQQERCFARGQPRFHIITAYDPLSPISSKLSPENCQHYYIGSRGAVLQGICTIIQGPQAHLSLRSCISTRPPSSGFRVLSSLWVRCSSPLFYASCSILLKVTNDLPKSKCDFQFSSVSPCHLVDFLGRIHLCSGLIPGRDQYTTWGTRDENQVSYVQEKCLTCSTISPVPHQSFCQIPISSALWERLLTIMT